jgi:hypothetical protein
VDCKLASSCEISCGNKSCIKGVECAGSSCTIDCSDYACAQVPIICRAKSCKIDCAGLQSCHQVQCANQPQSCEITCSGVQSCGTLLQSDAAQTNIACEATDTCMGAKALCCEDGVVCTGSAPTCP